MDNGCNSIENVIDFIAIAKEKITSISNEDEILNIWFRGEPITKSNCTPLIPRGYRIFNDPIIAAYIETRILESNLKSEFERQALPYLISKSIPINKWNIYFMMAHYGLRTRLLDWTQSALVALFFAVEDLNKNENSKVWILNPHRLNKFSTANLHEKNNGFHVILIPKDSLEQNLFDESFNIYTDELARIYLEMHFEKLKEDTSFYPLSIMPTYLDERMSMQQSCFTLFGNVIDGFFSIEKKERENFLDFIEIDKDAKRSIKQELHWLGITQRSIYPDLAGISKSIEDKYNYAHVIKRFK